MNDDDIREGDDIDPDTLDAAADDDVVGDEEDADDLSLELRGKKKKDLIEEDTESLDDLEEEELDEDEEMDDYEDKDLM